MLNINHLLRTRSAASLPCKIVVEDLIQPPSVKSFYHQGFFAVKRRAVFILGAKWKALVRGWRRDCVVGGMETRFQWRKAHSRTAKCEAFHFAPRLFFMFLFFWFHSRFGNNIIIAHVIFHWAHNWAERTVVKDWCGLSCNSSAVPRWLWRRREKRFARVRKKLYLCIAFREMLLNRSVRDIAQSG